MYLENIFKQNNLNAIGFELQLMNLKEATAQLCNKLEVRNFTML